MMAVTTSMKRIDRGADKIKRNLRKLAQEKLKAVVGLQGNVDTKLIIAAASNEYGTEHIPARPAWRNAVRSPELKAFMEATAEKYYSGRLELRFALGLIGTKAAALIQKSIASNTPPPNAPSTIARKGSSKTLIDTGRTRQSVTIAVRPARAGE